MLSVSSEMFAMEKKRSQKSVIDYAHVRLLATTSNVSLPKHVPPISKTCIDRNLGNTNLQI